MLSSERNGKSGQNKCKIKCRKVCSSYAKYWIAAVGTAIVLTALGVCLVYCKGLRFDQYSTTILSTTAGIAGTMFGLTAASYAFIWGDLRSDRKDNRHLDKVLQKYRKQIWTLFKISLILTLFVIGVSLVGLALAQCLMEDTLFQTVGVSEGTGIRSFYANNDFKGISALISLNLGAAVADLAIMGTMNWKIFKRNKVYANIAAGIIKNIDDRYDLQLTGACAGKVLPDSIEYEKIHNLEILVDRILKNHESIGEAFAESQRRDKLLASVILNGLNAQYGLETQSDNKLNLVDIYRKRTIWSSLSSEKQGSRWEKCRQRAQKEYSSIDDRISADNDTESSAVKCCPRDCCFLDVYDDLTSYRDNSLVCAESNIKKEKYHISLNEKRALRYTIKRRLLNFYLIGETFTDMDFTNVSFSGADLRYTNFSGSNLSHVRLKGANCENADFTSTRMTGMYFADTEMFERPKEGGEIELTYQDDGKKEWNPYEGHEATCLKNATFKEADVSRIYLKVPGQIEEDCGFPFSGKRWKLKEDQQSFSLEGTNFDYAKMFYAYFKNVSLINASLEKAQLYNAGFVMTKAKSSNFSKATLTNACFAWCDFENADFSFSLMSETVLVRVNFKGAKLTKANFSYSNILACSFYGASCQDVSFKNMIQDRGRLEMELPDAFEGVDFGKNVGNRFEYSVLTNTDFSGAILNNIHFVNCVGQNCLFAEAKGKGAAFRNSLFRSSVFDSTYFDDSCFQEVIFTNSVFIATEFEDSEFYNVDFSDTAFTLAGRVCFEGGGMSDVNFTNAKGLNENCFKSITLNRVDFRGTGMRPERFTNDVIIKNCLWEKE